MTAELASGATGLLFGLLFGVFIGWLAWRGRAASAEVRTTMREQELDSAKAELDRLLRDSGGTGREPRQAGVCAGFGTQEQPRKD